MAAQGVIYKIENLISRKCYIGATRNKPERRWYLHKWTASKGAGNAVHGALRKYGMENFTFEVIFSVLNLKDLYGFEEQFIEELGGFYPKGYNLTLGGEGLKGHPCPEHVKKANSLRMQDNQQGLGKIPSEKTRALISKANKGKNQYTAREGYTPKKMSSETRKRIGAANKGNTNCLGRVTPLETCKKLSESCQTKRKVFCVQLNVLFNSITEAAKYLREELGYLNAKPPGIIRCCKDNKMSMYGLNWRYII